MTLPPFSRLEEIEQREAKATPGPWRLCGCGKCAQVWSLPVDVMVAVGLGAKDESYTCGEGADDEQVQSNADFIARSRSDIPWLVSQLRAALSENEEMREERNEARATAAAMETRVEVMEAALDIDPRQDLSTQDIVDLIQTINTALFRAKAHRTRSRLIRLRDSLQRIGQFDAAAINALAASTPSSSPKDANT